MSRSLTNRFGLGLLGLGLLSAGLVSVCVTAVTRGAAQLLPSYGTLAGVTSQLPTAGAPLLPADRLGTLGGALVVVVAGLLLAALGLVWLISQIPRHSPALPFRFHDDVSSGITSLSPKVLARMVDRDVLAHPGVTAARTVLGGSTRSPHVLLRLTAYELTDLTQLVDDLERTVMTDLSTALERPIEHLSMEISLGADRPVVKDVAVRDHTAATEREPQPVPG